MKPRRHSTHGHDPAGKQRCEQCGRVGTRGFKTVGGEYEFEGRLVGQSYTVCASTQACRRRWPKRSEDELDRLLA
jgi:hypothetical protein